MRSLAKDILAERSYIGYNYYNKIFKLVMNGGEIRGESLYVSISHSSRGLLLLCL